jgi:hypothetical protein
MNPRDELSAHPVAGSRQNGAIPYPSDRVLEEVSRKATQLERRTRALEAENTKLRREHTKALLAAAQAQDALKEFHASAPDVPDEPADPRPHAPAHAGPAPVNGHAARDHGARLNAAAPGDATARSGRMPDDRRSGQPTFPGERASREPMDQPHGTGERSALGALTIAACLIAMTVNYAILLRYLLGDWLAGFAWPSF